MHLWHGIRGNLSENHYRKLFAVIAARKLGSLI
jgi:hypothetical protein